MSFSSTAITTASYILVGIIALLVIFIYVAVIFSDKIVKWRASKINEKRKEIIKILLQDWSFFIQIFIGLGASLILFSLSRTGVEIMTWVLFGLILIAAGFFLLFWRYLPLRNKILADYDKVKYPTSNE